VHIFHAVQLQLCSCYFSTVHAVQLNCVHVILVLFMLYSYNCVHVILVLFMLFSYKCVHVWIPTHYSGIPLIICSLLVVAPVLKFDQVIVQNLVITNAGVWRIVGVLQLKMDKILKAICHSAAAKVVDHKDHEEWLMFFQNNHKS